MTMCSYDDVGVVQEWVLLMVTVPAPTSLLASLHQSIFPSLPPFPPSLPPSLRSPFRSILECSSYF